MNTGTQERERPKATQRLRVVQTGPEQRLLDWGHQAGSRRGAVPGVGQDIWLPGLRPQALGQLSLPGKQQGGREESEGGGGSWLAWPCAECGECRRPAPACPPAEANAWWGAGAGRLPWATPSHLLPSEQGSDPAWAGRKGWDPGTSPHSCGASTFVDPSEAEDPKGPLSLPGTSGEQKSLSLLASRWRAAGMLSPGVVRRHSSAQNC